MLKRIKQWLSKRKTPVIEMAAPPELPNMYTQEQVEKAYKVGYNDGRRDGLAVARQQALKSLKEIVQWQNKNQPNQK